jgi:hypothetical protein
VHATVHFFHRRVAQEFSGWGADLAGRLYGGERPSGFCILAEFGGREGAAVSFWSTRAAASQSALRTVDGGPLPLDIGVYEVLQSEAGAAAGEPAVAAQLTVFDGPRSRAQADAAELAGRERLWPAVRQLPGLVAVHVLRDDDNGVVVLGLATGIEALEAAQKAILTTELLPDEDPALLSEPDRVQIHRVLAAGLPSVALAGEPA